MRSLRAVSLNKWGGKGQSSVKNATQFDTDPIATVDPFLGAFVWLRVWF